MHGELSELNRAMVEPQEIPPLFDAARSVIGGVSVNFFDIRRDDAHLRQFSMDMRRRQQLESVEKDVVAQDFNTRDPLGMKKIRNTNVQSAEKPLQRNFQNGKLCDVYLKSMVGTCSHGAEQFDRH